MKSEDVGLIVRAVSKIFNLCGHDPLTSQTDGQTDDMRSQDHALHYSASRGKDRIVISMSVCLSLCTYFRNHISELH